MPYDKPFLNKESFDNKFSDFLGNESFVYTDKIRRLNANPDFRKHVADKLKINPFDTQKVTDKAKELTDEMMALDKNGNGRVERSEIDRFFLYKLHPGSADYNVRRERLAKEMEDGNITPQEIRERAIE